MILEIQALSRRQNLFVLTILYVVMWLRARTISVLQIPLKYCPSGNFIKSNVI